MMPKNRVGQVGTCHACNITNNCYSHDMASHTHPHAVVCTTFSTVSKSITIVVMLVLEIIHGDVHPLNLT